MLFATAAPVSHTVSVPLPAGENVTFVSAQVNLPGKIVGDLQIVDDGVQDFVDLTRRGEKSISLQCIEHVVFCFMPPFALRFKRRPVMLGRFVLDCALRLHKKLV